MWRSFSQRVIFSSRQILIVPALLLIYAGIDILGAIDRPRDKAVQSGEDFKAWADRYMSPEKSLGCTSDDLWGARCGLLHSYTSESRTSQMGSAKMVFYSWGIGKSEDYNLLLQQSGFDDTAVAVQVETLHKCFSNGIFRFVASLETDNDQRELVYGRANKFFKHVSPDIHNWPDQG